MVPLCTPVGSLADLYHLDENKEKEPVVFDQLGLGVTLYFKLVKVMICVLFVSSILMLPYLIVFKQGSEASFAEGMDKILGSFSLGNIGQSLDMCVSTDINNCDTIDLICPDDTTMAELRQFGIEDLTSRTPTICPSNLANSTSIKLNVVD